MLPDSAFPGPLPLGRQAGLKLLAHLDDYRHPRGAFLTFVMIPVEARLGDWRFAGVTRSLADAADRVETFIAPLGGTAADGTTLLQYLLEPEVSEEPWNLPDQSPIEGLGSHRLVLCVQADAPYDNTGVCIVEVEAPADAAGGFAESAVVAGWRQEALTQMLRHGTRLWGAPRRDVRLALEQRSGPDDWVRWSQAEWGEDFDGWEDALQPRTEEEG